MKKILFVTVIMVLGMSYSATAQTRTGKINKTQKKQQVRIQQGVKSGELTRREAFKLEKEQHRIQRKKRVAKADGIVTKRERKSIKVQQAKASRHIAVQKHDRQKR